MSQTQYSVSILGGQFDALCYHAVPALSARTLLARVVQADGTLMTRSDFASLAYEIVDDDANGQVLASGSLTVADVVYDTAQTGGGWPAAWDGYNFAWPVASTIFPKSRLGHRLRATVYAIPAGGDSDDQFAIGPWGMRVIR